ncbi:Por secretion system C-terminal sorting domain-containing protein [Lutibacter agarilyticus]|uniref:Por secretion system C-terminal sorting domain-containing protein n=1 Tax=Lutibacter agarilyticus TaxID=1109740 RepID=A0A238XI40_9FLAO|nr:T9SS type A sorting domain-containing protein [Lutibacter agarilyticus]SNR58370.1 Por secretion system C-terminal sorting domain-containing protein [Lutibacter agarilyticus]
MNKLKLTITLLLTIGFIGKAQTTRYFEFSTNCGSGNWQDTTFIAATSNQVLIDTVLANIAKPFNQRKFINGNIDYGNGGYNHNASHWFLWHFIPNEWDLTEMAIEVCDGCPYTDVDADTAYWVGIIGQFCPWSSRPVKEVTNTLGIDTPIFENEISLYPNPTKDKLNLKWNSLNNITVTIYNSIGQELWTVYLSKQHKIIDISELENGIYFLKIRDRNKIAIKKIIVV